MSGGIRASSIPNNVKKMIQNLQEIYINHTDDEIYSMLKECSMDPNETAQKLLHQDTFHEVKRRRDRKSEQTNREIVDSRRVHPSGRGARGRKGIHSSRHLVQGTGDVRNTSFNKENGFNHASDRSGSSPPVVQEGHKKDKGSSVIDITNGPTDVLPGVTKRSDTSNVLPKMSSRPQSRSDRNKRSSLISGAKAQSISSSSDPVVVPTSDTRVPSVGAIKREVGIQRSPVEKKASIPAEHRSNASKMSGKSQGAGKFQAMDVFQSSLIGSSSSSRPSSNYGSRSQQGMGSQKAGPIREWKPKPTTTINAQGHKAPADSEGLNILLDTRPHHQSVERTTDSEELTDKVQQQLESLHVRDAQHVIIPSHIHVPDAVRTVLNFGSFDAAFVISPNLSTEPENKVSKSVSEVHQTKEDVAEEHCTSQNTLTPSEEVEYADCSPTPEKAETSSLGDASVPSSSVPECNDTKDMASIPQSSSVHRPENYSVGAIPPVLGSPLGQMAGSETQARDVSGAPGLVVQQPLHSSSGYAQFYRSPSDNDGRVSPFGNHEGTSKYTVFPSHTSQSESGNSVVLQPPAPPLATQSTGAVPNSIAVTQQPLPIFRQPPGIHMPHYPPNFIPYGHYFNPFYIPPPTMHQFLGNNAFPQQSQAGNLFPPPPPGPTVPATVKFPHSQYNKPGNNAGNSAHVGVGGGYGPYGAHSAGFNPRSGAALGNTTASEDLAVSQFKDNVYISGHQTEGSAVWYSGQGRDISSLPANTFYNLPPQAHHVTYGPTQPGQGPYAGVFHPAQAVSATVHPLLQASQAMPGALDMGAPMASIYQQQPQQPQMNWPSNY